MSRFDHLEFDSNQPPRSRPTAPLPADADHDEHYWLRQADLARREGRHEEALRFYSRALERDRSLVVAWLGQAQMLIALGEYPEADLWARKAGELFRGNPELIAARAQALIRRGDLRHAQPLCDSSLTMESQSYYPWLVRGELMLARRQAVAQHCFDKTRQISTDWLVCLEIADIYLYYRRPTPALAWLRRAVEQNPQSAYCWYRQGDCELELGLLTPARRSLTHCLEINPGYVPASRALIGARAGWSPWAYLKGMFRRS
jgi:tetratricopeptide (TPR) repeat protein